MDKLEKTHDFAVIFDMDGVIVDSNPFHRKVLTDFCQKHGYMLSEDQMKTQIFGRTNKDWLTELFGGNITLNKIREYEEEMESQFRKDFAPHIKPIKGLIRFLEELKRNNITIAVASSAPKLNVDFVLKKTGTTNYFNTIINGDSIEDSKPHPEIYLKAVETIGIIPQRCIVIEDSLSGIEAAKKADCKVIGITTTHSHQELTLTDLIINDFNEIRIMDLEALF
jgi:beta-phosphoglucomutase